MTRLDELIEINGEACEIHRDTGSSYDSYQDIIPVWGKVADEYVWVQKRGPGSLQATGITAAGRENLGDYLGLFKSTSVARAQDVIKIGAVEYELRKIVDVSQKGGDASHREGHLIMMQEG